MTKSQIFKAAHETARTLSPNFGSYAKRLSIGLKVAYRKARSEKAEALARVELAKKEEEYKASILKVQANRKEQQPTSCYFGAHSWEKNLAA